MKKFTLFVAILTVIVIVATTGCSTGDAVHEEILSDPSYQAMSRVKAEVLSVQAALREKAEFADTDEESVTILTVGFRIEDAADAEHVNLKKIQFAGSEQTPLTGTGHNAFWYNEKGNYAIVMLRIAGEVDASDIKYTLYNTAGDITYINKLENTIAGFGNYETLGIAEDEQPVIRQINGCHYITVDRWKSDSSIKKVENGACISNTVSYVLIPLEGDLAGTLDDNDVRLSIDTAEELSETIRLSAHISDGYDEDARYDHKYNNAPDYQTLVHLTAETFVETEVYESEAFNESIIRQVNSDALRASVLNVVDQTGNTVSFAY